MASRNDYAGRQGNAWDGIDRNLPTINIFTHILTTFFKYNRMKSANIYQNVAFNENKPVITVLFETDFTKEIRIAMSKGTLMKEHKTSFPIVVEIVEGEIDFGVKQPTKSLKKSDIIALESNVPHDLKANENSIIRLTLTKYDEAERVKNIIKLTELK